jgi:hypothetical protein
MKADHLKQIEFIKSHLREGLDRKDILQLFSKTFKNQTPRTFDSRLKIAREAINDEIKAINELSNVIVAGEANKQALKTLSVAQRIDILAKIATGELTLTKEVATSEGVVSIVEEPSFNDRKGAIAEINKMAGDYAATKQEVEFNKPFTLKIGYDNSEDG